MLPPPLHVVCAIIERPGFVLAARRKQGMNHFDKWEFPGGKMEGSETPVDCIVREIQEEFGVLIDPIHRLPDCRYEYPYPKNPIFLIPYICKERTQSRFELRDHNQIEWVSVTRLLDNRPWTAPDIKVVKEYMKYRRIYIEDDY